MIEEEGAAWKLVDVHESLRRPAMYYYHEVMIGAFTALTRCCHLFSGECHITLSLLAYIS